MSYDDDVREADRVLEQAAAALPARVSDRAPRVLFHEFGDSSILSEVLVWVQDPWQARVPRSQLNHAIWHALREADIAIPLPQRVVVHLVPRVTDAPPSRPGSG